MAVSINKNWLLLAGAIALGGLAFFLSNKAINSRIAQIEEEAQRGKTMVEVVVASRSLQPGELLDSTVVSVREIPAEFVNKTTILPEQFETVEGQSLQVGVAKGEPLLSSYTTSRGGEVFAAILKDGRRAVTIEVDEVSSISGMLRPGDRIDLMLTAKPHENAGATGTAQDFTFPMLSNVEVLATGQAQKARPAAGAAEAQGYSHITLDVTPQEGTRIIAAKGAGRITAVLRSPGDKQPNPSMAMSMDDVVGAISPSDEGQRRMVEFIIGGSNGAAVSSTPMLDAAMQDPKNKAIAERVAMTMAGGAGGGAPPAVAASPTLPPGFPMPLSPSAAAAAAGVRR